MNKPFLGEFCHTYNLERILKKLTSYKSPKNPTSIDLVLTNKKEKFLEAKYNETEFSGFHKMVAFAFKTSFKKV